MNQTIKIDKGIPVPPKRASKACQFPWEEMQAGDSFSVPVPEGRDPAKYGHQIVGGGRTWAKRHAPGATFTVRAESGGKAVRIWMLTRPAPLNPVAPAVRVHRIQDDDEGKTPRSTKNFAHAIPSFTNGSKARTVKGKRY